MIFQLNRNSSDSLHAQICEQIRTAILTGILTGGEQLPPTRQMKEEYGVSRNVWSEAYEQLTAEGFLESRQGSGTFVMKALPPLPPGPRVGPEKIKRKIPLKWKADFSVGTPNPTDFPLEKWGNALKKSVLSYTPAEMGYQPPGGLPSTREALANWLAREKGVTARPDDIFLCAGSYQALMLAAEVVKRSSGEARPHLMIENPSFTPIAEGAQGRGFRIIPVDTDDGGIDPALVESRDDITAVCVTPSHIFPRGEVFPIHRRLALCRLAQEKQFHIIENDFEGDFRLKGSPIPPLFSLGTGRVLYTGTFSQLLYPGVRLGYLVVPEPLVEETENSIAVLGYEVPLAHQKALSTILSDGTLSRHRRKMRRRYQQRQTRFMEALKRTFGSALTFHGTDTGLYLTVEIKDILFDKEAAEIMQSAGIRADYEFRHYRPRGSRERAPGLLLGYGRIEEGGVSRNINLLKKVIDEIHSKKTGS